MIDELLNDLDSLAGEYGGTRHGAVASIAGDASDIIAALRFLVVEHAHISGELIDDLVAERLQLLSDMRRS